MRLATWCVGRIKARLEYLLHWLNRRKPDVVALQKTFASTGQFPTEGLRRAGYHSVLHIKDEEFRNGWGVAVLSRRSLPTPEVLQVGLPRQGPGAARFLTVGVGGLEFSSVYSLYGNPRKYGVKGALERKLAWMKQLREHFRSGPEAVRRRVLAGDFNVVSRGKARPGVLNHTEQEREALDALLRSGLFDLCRHHHLGGKAGYNYGFNRRRPATSRLHRILGTKPVAEQVRDAWVDLDYRRANQGLRGGSWGASAPVIVDLDGSAG